MCVIILTEIQEEQGRNLLLDPVEVVQPLIRTPPGGREDPQGQIQNSWRDQMLR